MFPHSEGTGNSLPIESLRCHAIEDIELALHIGMRQSVMPIVLDYIEQTIKLKPWRERYCLRKGEWMWGCNVTDRLRSAIHDVGCESVPYSSQYASDVWRNELFHEGANLSFLLRDPYLREMLSSVMCRIPYEKGLLILWDNIDNAHGALEETSLHDDATFVLFRRFMSWNNGILAPHFDHVFTEPGESRID